LTSPRDVDRSVTSKPTPTTPSTSEKLRDGTRAGGVTLLREIYRRR
jgi:hypothetical protein